MNSEKKIRHIAVRLGASDLVALEILTFVHGNESEAVRSALEQAARIEAAKMVTGESEGGT